MMAGIVDCIIEDILEQSGLFVNIVMGLVCKDFFL